MSILEIKLDNWKKRLLDLGKRNRLINFRETKRSNLNITSPGYEELFKRIVISEDTLVFPYPRDKKMEEDDDSEELITEIIEGNLETDRTLKEQQRTLKTLRARAKTAMEEQGVNILYLSFGFLKWRENVGSQSFVSPLVLVPVMLTIESITEPYEMTIHDDEIVVNPTLAHKLNNDFGINLPEFDSQNDDIAAYLDQVADLVKKSGWTVEERVSLSLLSFLKINMYYDLVNHAEKLKDHGIIKALCGDTSEVNHVPEEMNDYNHDVNERPVDVFQVVDADSSQQDAVALSKRGISFVLQGPPGTGKSQTITNIIAEALADGKKVLFVSEKMAALEVVHRRLSHVELDDFCLILHSHKANKKEVLKSLGDTLKLDRVSVRDEALYKLEVLENEIEKLNNYCLQLHTPCPPLGKTIFEVNGILAKISHAPDLIFSLKDVENTTAEKLRRYIYLVSEFAKTINKMSEDYNTNSWKGCIVEQVTYDLRQNIDVSLKQLMPQVAEIANKINEMFEDFLLENNLTYYNMNAYEKLFECVASSPVIPKTWLKNSDIEELLQQTRVFNDQKSEYLKIRTQLSANYTDSIFELDGISISNALGNYFNMLFSKLDSNSYKTERDIYLSFNYLLSICTDSKRDVINLKDLSGRIAAKLDLKVPENLEEIKKLYDFMIYFEQLILATNSWFEVKNNKLRFDLLEQAKILQKEINHIKTETFSVYEKEILNIAYEEMLKRFKTDYTSVFKVFKKSYRQDCREIRGLRTVPVKKIQDSEIIELLNNLKSLHEKISWFKEQELLLKEMLGGLFRGVETNFADIENAFASFEKVTDFFNGTVPENIKPLLISGKNYNMFSSNVTEINSYLNSVNIKNYKRAFSEKDFETKNLFEILQSKENIELLLTGCKEGINKIKATSKEQNVYDFHKNSLQSLVRLQEIKSSIEAQSGMLKQQYQFLFEGIDTDWEYIHNSLVWTSQFKEYIGLFNLNEEFQNKTITGTYTEKGKACAEFIKSSREQICGNIEWFNGLFDEKSNITKLNFFALQDKIERCLKNLSGLEEWIDFKSARDNCNKEGLSEFVSLVLEEQIDQSLIKDAFTKRFYRLWLDAILPKYPAVYSFRGHNHEDTIKRFAGLDKEQMKIARLRIREKLISNLPDVNRITAAVDEVGILKRELGKQKRIMPIRKLFARTPTLLPCLKPCLMMSPLSVSLFLQSDSYDFDMVIFDEASQVCTENAVGAIMRTKQIIVAGDSKQLPPTNFFNASISDGDYDVDDEESDDYVAYESVLDELVTVLPERSLKWHYRSRHEHLIAFSNVKIYGNSLITFPTHIDKEPGYGVEYVFVEDGVYDRAGKRNNTNEARRVASLVFKHFDRYSGRSLGVIAFSEAQQQAIDTAVRQLRIQNPQYEGFFNEDKEEPFFIKNLENVQGDERDTIIFSIGYAKDANGVMYMNFGPLSRDGGYRRLNVAITRAKYNVKLVGSIHPTDIKLENTNSQGVKMLRNYIEFAINDIRVLENEIIYDKFVNLESPFEESVYDFLVTKGVRVATQVGCSGYRIDMAVKHPTLDGRFVIGIECDGATYHSSRTARERDRLRQGVLEDIGWKIYRIWSTDWIKDPLNEGNKLLEAVNRAISEYNEDPLYNNHTSQNETCYGNNSNDNYLVVEKTLFNRPTEYEKNWFGFEIYQEADINSVPHRLRSLPNIIEHVVQAEYPIHFELLCRRIAPFLGNQKATKKIRQEVIYGLSKIKDRVIKKGDFLFPKNYDAVVPRVPADGETPRAIIYISPDELGVAMLKIISESYGITRESLFQVTAREYGFNRTGINITIALEEAFEIILKDKFVKIVEDRISIVPWHEV